MSRRHRNRVLGFGANTVCGKTRSIDYDYDYDYEDDYDYDGDVV